MNEASNKYRILCVYIALAVATIAVYWQVHNYDFVNYDDGSYVSENQHIQSGLTAGSIIWAFTEDHAGNWHPLTSLTHMLDWQLFGANPGRHHLTNLLLHLINTLLLFAVFKQMTGAVWASSFVAAAFALHPLHVESVAWISSRKDLLSGLFWILTMAAYAHYVRHPHIKWYSTALLAFALGLMAKPMLVTLPFVLLLLDYWPLGRYKPAKNVKGSNFYYLLREKIPFFILTVILSIVTFLVEQSGGSVRTTTFPLKIRIANAFVSYIRYIGKTIWPVRLAAFYPHPADNLSVWQAVLAALLLLAISIWVIRLAKKHRYLLTGWFWFLGTLVPVIGLIQVGGQALADRYTYIPLTGLFIIICWALPELLGKWKYQKIILSISAAVVVLAFSICTWRQQRYWRNSEALFRHAVEVTGDNEVANCYLAFALQDQGRIDQAIGYYLESLRVRPNYIDALNGLGTAFLEANKPDEAIVYLSRALQLAPDLAEAHFNLGMAFAKQGRFNQAVKHYTEALRTAKLQRQYTAVVHGELGYALARSGNFDEAVTHFEKSLKIRPDNAQAHYNLANAFNAQGKLDEAVSHYRRALKLNPDYARAHNNLGTVLLSQGKLDEAISHFNQALQIDPGYTSARRNLDAAIQLKAGPD